MNLGEIRWTKLQKDAIIQHSKEVVLITLIPCSVICFWIPQILAIPVVLYGAHIELKKLLNKL